MKHAEGQDLVDCLTSLRLVSPELDPALHPQLASLLPPLIANLSSQFSVIRNTAAKCLAVLCDVITDDAMRQVVDIVVPMVGDAQRVPSRRGSVEAIHRKR
jgi:TATA-binding protein-associated factor